MNRAQVQPGHALSEFYARFGLESQCRRALCKACWPRGFRCPARDDQRRSFHRDGQIHFESRSRRRQTTLLAGTIFQAGELALTSWLLALQLLTPAKTNLSVLEFMR
jgi:hypothetical protein